MSILPTCPQAASFLCKVVETNATPPDGLREPPDAGRGGGDREALEERERKAAKERMVAEAVPGGAVDAGKRKPSETFPRVRRKKTSNT